MIRSWGHTLRLTRLTRSSGSYFLLALDHALSFGVVPGLEEANRWIEFADRTTISGVVLAPGHAMSATAVSRKAVLIQAMGLPSQVSDRNKVSLTSVRAAIALGADAISLQLSFGASDFPNAIQTVANKASRARDFGLPVMLMILRDSTTRFDTADKIQIANQLGVDLVKINVDLKHDTTSRTRLREAAAWGAHVLLAGGDRADSLEALESAFQLAEDTGFRGVCIGRNVFQSQDPLRVVELVDRYFPP